jgi:anthranilate phosphoribosyltransferase
MNTAVARTTSQTMRVTQKGEESAAQWIKGVLDGSGSSPAQIIVAVVIGCIPLSVKG